MTDVESSPPAYYATLGPRLRAVVRDLFVYFAGLALLIVLGSIVESPTSFRPLAVIILVGLLLYEPLFVAIGGGTIGHRSLGLRVARAKDLGRVGLGRALLRAVIKDITGFVAFVLVQTTSRHQALHDLIARTVVIPRDTIPRPDVEVAPARIPDRNRVLPSPVRRLVFILLYVLATAVIVAIVSDLVFSDECAFAKQCTPLEKGASVILGLLEVAGLVAIAALGWRGYLWGARGKQAGQDAPGSSGAV